MNVERVFRILWGPTLENALDFAFPVVGEAPTFSRQPRPNSSMVPNGATALAVITGRYFRLKVRAKYFGGQQNFGATGLQAFIDWAADSNSFTLVPNLSLPTLSVPGCYLEGPFAQLNPAQEKDGTQTLPLTILHPTVDLGVAWRGLFFEYVAGQSLTDPVRASFSRSSVGYEITPQGYLLVHPADGVCDGHYVDRVSGVQTTLIENAVTNDVTNPEDLSNASWDKTTNVTITANNARAPDQALSADLVVENVAVGVLHAIFSTPGYAIASGDVVTGLCFVRGGGRFRGQVYFCDATNTNRVGISYNLLTGTIASSVAGAGALTASRITPLAGGWYMLWWRGTINAGVVSIRFQMDLFDASGSNIYTGDGASGVYLWGVTAVHGSTKSVASYTPTSSTTDILQFPLPAGLVTPSPIWVYAKFIEQSTARVDVYNSPSFAICDPGGAGPKFYAVNERLNGQPQRYGTELWLTSGVPSIVSPAVGAMPTVTEGDIVEQLSYFDSALTVTMRQALNGGAETAASQANTTGFSLPAAWSGSPRILIANAGAAPGYSGVAVIRIGPLVTTGPAAVTTIAQARFA